MAHTAPWNPGLSLSAQRQARAGVAVAVPAALRDEAENAELALLIGAVARRETKALERLYARSVGRIHALALRITRRPDTAEEVTEDVFVQVWNTAARFDAQRGSPLAWLLTLCRSRALDALRAADPAQPHADAADLLDANGGGATAQDLLEAAQGHAAMHQALQRMTAPQRQLIALAYFRGLSQSEMAAQLGLPLGTVKSQMRQALADLRRAIDGA